MLNTVFERLGSSELVPVLIVGSVAIAGTIIAVVAMIASTWMRASMSRSRRELTRMMLERGASSEEIARVLELQGHDLRRESRPLSTASEVLALSDDEWAPALVLEVASGRCLVHYVGREMDDNEWVGEDRLRFPTSSPLPDLIAGTLPEMAARNGRPTKPLVEADL